MKFFKREGTAIAVLIVVIIASSLYGISKRPKPIVPNPDDAALASSDIEQVQEPAVDPNYELGYRYYTAGDFKNAILKLRQVTEDSSCFAEALELLAQACTGYRKEILGTADKYVLTQDYKTAINIVGEALMIIPEDTELIGAQNKFKTMVRSALIEKTNQFAADGDYPEAIAAIGEAIEQVGQDAELNALHNKYIGDYKNTLKTEADQAYHTEGYESAAAILRQGVQIVGDDAELLELIAEYEACVPYSFYSLTDRDSGYYYDGDLQGNYSLSDSMYGVEKTPHNNVISCMDNEGNTTRLYVKSEFKKISGTIFFRLDRNDDTVHKARIRIYGDGNLLYEKSVSNLDSSVYFEVDISDVVFLDVNIYTGFYSLSGNGIQFGGISDLNLFKNAM